jgi:uncharacterized membrane protein YfcA
MLPYIVIAVSSLLVAGLTLFSGFGIGMLLMPVFVIFFPTDVAVAMTAIVHFSNNVFKVLLVGAKAHWSSVWCFGIPATLASFVGARMLVGLSELKALYTYVAMDRTFAVTPVNLTLAVLLALFALSEIVPRLHRVTFPERYLPLGGVLSGFFGGLSGHQGALRSAFLLRTGLSKDVFISTGVIIAFFVDIPRIAVYGTHMASADLGQNWPLLLAAVTAALLGAVLGKLLVKKITIGFIRWSVAILLFIAAAGLGTGVI